MNKLDDTKDKKRLHFSAAIYGLEESKIFIAFKARLFEAPKVNYNNVRVTEDFISEIVDNSEKYVCLPLMADFENLISGNYERLGHMYIDNYDEFRSTQIGSFYKFEREYETDIDGSLRTFLVGYGRVLKRNEKIRTALLNLYSSGSLNFSFEISCSSYTLDDNGTITIDADDGNYLEAMSIVYNPAYESAKALELVASIKDAFLGDSENSVNSSEKVESNYDTKKGDNTVSKKIKNLVSNIETSVDELLQVVYTPSVKEVIDTSSTEVSEDIEASDLVEADDEVTAESTEEIKEDTVNSSEDIDVTEIASETKDENKDEDEDMLDKDEEEDKEEDDVDNEDEEIRAKCKTDDEKKKTASSEMPEETESSEVVTEKLIETIEYEDGTIGEIYELSVEEEVEVATIEDIEKIVSSVDNIADIIKKIQSTMDKLTERLESLENMDSEDGIEEAVDDVTTASRINSSAVNNMFDDISAARTDISRVLESAPSTSDFRRVFS